MIQGSDSFLDLTLFIHMDKGVNEMNPTQFAAELKKQGIALNERQLEQFHIYFKTLVEWNEKINLTALTEEEDVYLKHFYDSISAAFYYDFTKEVHICDVGAG